MGISGMAMKRKATSQGGRALKRFRRRPNIRRPLRRPGRMPKTHNFKRVMQLPDLIVGSTAVNGVLVFRLNAISNVTEFTNLFDRYRIRGVQVKFVPAANSSDLNPSGTQVLAPNIHSVVDLNDGTAPTGVTELMEYDTYRMNRGLKGLKRYFSPRVSQEVYRSALTTSYGMANRNQWFDLTTGGIDIPHFAMKYSIDGGTTITFRVYVTYYFQCQGTK